MTQKPYIPVGEVQDDMASTSMGLEVTMLQQSPPPQRQLALDIYLEWEISLCDVKPLWYQHKFLVKQNLVFPHS